MQTLETSAKPRTRSDEALLNSAASSRPRSIAETISPPGSALTAAPRPVNTSIEMPTVRNLTPWRSSALVTGFLNQPSGWVGIGPYGNETTLAPIEAYSFSSSSLPPPYLCQASSMLASMRIARARTPQRQRVLLAVVIDQHAVAAVERALRHRVEQAEGRHHRAGRKHLDLEVAAGHVVDLLGVVEGVFVEDVLGRPGALPAHADRALRARDARRGDGCGGARGGHFQEAATARSLVLGWFGHEYPPG